MDRTEPGEVIRAIRKRSGLTLSAVSVKTGLAVSTLSKLEKGHVSLSYDKLVLLSKGLDVDMAQLLNPAPVMLGTPVGGGRRAIQKSGEGHRIETRSYSQLYLATELITKRFTPILVEVKSRSMDEFRAEFGDFIRHPGEEFALVLEGELEFHSELYAPVRLKTGDSLYFDSDMGHAYLKASETTCRIMNVCSPHGTSDSMIETFVNASERHAAPAKTVARKPRARAGSKKAVATR